MTKNLRDLDADTKMQNQTTHSRQRVPWMGAGVVIKEPLPATSSSRESTLGSERHQGEVFGDRNWCRAVELWQDEARVNNPSFMESASEKAGAMEHLLPGLLATGISGLGTRDRPPVREGISGAFEALQSSEGG
jgi:hypothetical protein